MSLSLPDQEIEGHDDSGVGSRESSFQLHSRLTTPEEGSRMCGSQELPSKECRAWYITDSGSR